ncbi:hypothetical protein [Engelhardtia mirabilis]|uniref:Secreted protein n=1 Tax=Engelhardtia mirabilis TaxID=2528011 RepID=A0A518BHE8_9BACT|nr:hypothetical protein Pla133_14820 [Planctomycetes bacterium Pla133]QDV00736.1 hypothetical protein Pla86_14810 [Planctomycetes bacterium Pla86]
MIRFRSSHAIAALSALALFSATSPTGHSQNATAPSGGYQEEPGSACPNEGAASQPAAVVWVGPDACADASLVDSVIGQDADGNDVVHSEPKCPSKIKIKPTHMGRAPKDGFRRLTSGVDFYQFQSYYCAGQPFTPYCVKDGDQDVSPDSFETFSEIECDGLIGGSN